MEKNGQNDAEDGRVAGRDFPHMNAATPYFPATPVCPWCGRRKVHEPHSMAILNGGALLMNSERTCGEMDERMDGFLSLIWHGAHGGGEGQNRERHCSLRLADNCRGGQFEIYFCSTQCLRGYLNHCVDRLEAEICGEEGGTT